MDVAALIDKICGMLKDERLEHTFSVHKVALRLAKQYQCNTEKAAIAAILHDMCRDYPLETLNEYVKTYNLDNIYINNRSLSHAKVASLIARKEFGITDTEIVNAISFHTTGRENMTKLEKIIYLSDIIEEGRSFEGIEVLRKLAFENLNSACLLALDMTIKHVIDKKEYLHIDTLLARNYFLINKKGGKDEHKKKCYQGCKANR